MLAWGAKTITALSAINFVVWWASPVDASNELRNANLQLLRREELSGPEPKQEPAPKPLTGADAVRERDHEHQMPPPGEPEPVPRLKDGADSVRERQNPPVVDPPPATPCPAPGVEKEPESKPSQSASVWPSSLAAAVHKHTESLVSQETAKAALANPWKRNSMPRLLSEEELARNRDEVPPPTNVGEKPAGMVSISDSTGESDRTEKTGPKRPGCWFKYEAAPPNEDAPKAFQSNDPMRCLSTSQGNSSVNGWLLDTFGMDLLQSGSSANACKGRKKSFDAYCNVDSEWLFVPGQDGEEENTDEQDEEAN